MIKSLFTILITFLPCLNEDIVDREAYIDWGPAALRFSNKMFLYEFFAFDEAKFEKYWGKYNLGARELVFVDIKNQRLSVLDLTDTFRVVIETKISSGRNPKSTPCGEFKILKKKKSRPSHSYGGIMLYWNCLTADESIGIHGLENKFYEMNLGKPVSHGCIRVSNLIAKNLYLIAPVGTEVFIE